MFHFLILSKKNRTVRLLLDMNAMQDIFAE